VLGALALDRVTDRPHHQLGLELALEQVILSALLHRGDRGLLVLEAGDDNDRHVRRVVADAAHNVEAAGVGKPEVEQDDIDRLSREFAQGGLQPPAGAKPEPGIVENRLQLCGLCRAVFDD